MAIAQIYTFSDNHYIPNVEILIVCLAGVGFIVGAYMNYYDVTHESVLNRGTIPLLSSKSAEKER